MNAKEMRRLLKAGGRLVDLELYQTRASPPPGKRFSVYNSRGSLESDELTPLGRKALEVLADFGISKTTIFPIPGGIWVMFGNERWNRPSLFPELKVARDRLLELGYECGEAHCYEQRLYNQSGETYVGYENLDLQIY